MQTNEVVESQAATQARESAATAGTVFDKQTQQVREMYEHYPYPSPASGNSLIKDLSNVLWFLFPDNDLDGWKILDGGCGTGHRILAVAKRYPKAGVTAVDMTQASLEVGARTAEANKIGNVKFQRANLLTLDISDRFDLIVSTGVIHHLTDPALGLANLAAHLAGDGVMLTWLYHPFGEFNRLRERELALLLWGEQRENFEEGIAILRDLNLNLSAEQYGTRTSNLASASLSQTSINIDAYLHPIVNAYRFDEAIEMFRTAGLDWVIIASINLEGESKLIDLNRKNPDSFFHLHDADVFKTERLYERYEALPNRDKIRAIELALKPTGFTIIGGRGDSYLKLGSDFHGMVMDCGTL